ncbi:MAG: hypothetical protein GTO18_06170 [Anaerolineales bacterium]|nr:hypothetical protein [Anaerolineales bacterium]
MKITRRQETFIRKLMDLYHEVEGPIHYSAIADHLGVSRITAYDMLRLLEEKGLVTSQYQLEGDKSGPGRSKVVFIPTDQAHQMVVRYAGVTDGEDWEVVKDRILDQLRTGEDDDQLGIEMLARIPDVDEDPLRYCLEIATIIILRLRRHPKRHVFLEYLPLLMSSSENSDETTPGLAAGFALGLLIDEIEKDPEWGCELIKHVRQYQRIVADMEADRRQRIADSLMEVFEMLMDMN